MNLPSNNSAHHSVSPIDNSLPVTHKLKASLTMSALTFVRFHRGSVIVSAMIVFILGAFPSVAVGACSVVKDAAYYLSLSVDDFYASATRGNRVGDCYIAEAKRGFCDLYAKSAIQGKNGDRGWPKTTSNTGTGCVRAPFLPRRVRTCYYRASNYNLPASLVNTFCTDDGKANAVAQLKHAVRNNACKLPVRPAPVTCIPPCVCN